MSTGTADGAVSFYDVRLLGGAQPGQQSLLSCNAMLPARTGRWWLGEAAGGQQQRGAEVGTQLQIGDGWRLPAARMH
jgi:hypothetical protein